MSKKLTPFRNGCGQKWIENERVQKGASQKKSPMMEIFPNFVRRFFAAAGKESTGNEEVMFFLPDSWFANFGVTGNFFF